VNVFEVIGMLWVVFSSALATFAIGYLAVVGLKTVVKVNFSWLRKLDHTIEESEPVPTERVEVKEAFKVAH
jgi:hypothetical protein